MNCRSIFLRCTSLILMLCLLCTVPLSASAIVISPDFAPTSGTENEEIILSSHRYHVENGNLVAVNPEVMQPYAEAYTPGDIDIQDVLGSSSGWISADSKQVVGEAALGAAITILCNVPKVGNVVSTVSNVINMLKPFYAALSAIDYSKTMQVQTSYSYRNFTHRILIYTNAYQWKEVGTSLSRYYYRHSYVRAYNRNTGDYFTASYDFTHSNGCNPAKICEAPNYRNYTVLAQRGREAYASNLIFRETYND